MNSALWKCSIIAIFFVCLHCDNNPLPVTKVHPVLILSSVVVESTPMVVIATSVSHKYSQSRIVSDTCYLTYPQHTIVDGTDVIVIDSVAVLNDSDTLRNGRFYGSWEIPDSILIYGSITVSGTVMDDEGHLIGGSILLDQNMQFPEKSFTITSSATNGSIALDPDGGTYPNGTAVTATATPDSGYTFSGWSGDLSGSDNPASITVTGNVNITANFSETTAAYTLTSSATNGSITLDPADGTYPSGTVVTVTATPGSGYAFSDWSGDLSGSTNPATITMSANMSITANFTAISPNSYTLTSSATNGLITLDPADGTYPAGTVVSVTATPNTDYVFSGWSGDLSGSANPATVTMTSNMSITANFSPAVSPNLIANGDFSNGLTGWDFASISPSTATPGIDSDQFYADITNDNGTNVNIKLMQINISLENGKSYTLSFDAKAESPRAIFVQVKRSSGSDVIWQNKTISAAMTNYTVTFRNGGATASNYQLLFFLGAAGQNDVWLDNIQIHAN